MKEIHLWILGKWCGGGRGSTLNVSSDGDDQRIFGGAKFFILIFLGRKMWQLVFFVYRDLRRDFLGI